MSYQIIDYWNVKTDYKKFVKKEESEDVVYVHTVKEVKELEERGYRVVTDSDLKAGGEV